MKKCFMILFNGPNTSIYKILQSYRTQRQIRQIYLIIYNFNRQKKVSILIYQILKYNQEVKKKQDSNSNYNTMIKIIYIHIWSLKLVKEMVSDMRIIYN